MCNVILGPSALGQHYTTSGHNFSVLTSAPVNICIVFQVIGRILFRQVPRDWTTIDRRLSWDRLCGAVFQLAYGDQRWHMHTFNWQLKAYLFHIWCADEHKEHCYCGIFLDSGAGYKTDDLLTYFSLDWLNDWRIDGLIIRFINPFSEFISLTDWLTDLFIQSLFQSFHAFIHSLIQWFIFLTHSLIHSFIQSPISNASHDISRIFNLSRTDAVIRYKPFIIIFTETIQNDTVPKVKELVVQECSCFRN